MRNWAEDAMREAVEILFRIGRDDTALDIKRILGRIAFEDLEVLRCPDSDCIADGIMEARSSSELADLLGHLAKAMGFDHCTLHVISEAPTTNFSTKVLTTYPNAWISRYVDRRYATLDPVSRACVTAEHGFFWDGLDQSAPALRAFWIDSVDNGIGPSGYTLPMITERGDKLALSIASHMPAEAFRDRVSWFEGDLFSLGIFLADAFCRLASEDRPASFNPTDDQLTILRSIAMGADDAELRDRTYQYGSYVTLERSICALFRTRTVAQAAILAARIGLLAEAPLVRSDILGASTEAAQSLTAATADSLLRRRLARLRSSATSDLPAPSVTIIGEAKTSRVDSDGPAIPTAATPRALITVHKLA